MGQEWGFCSVDDVLFLSLDAGHRDATSLGRFSQPYIKFFLYFSAWIVTVQ